MMLAYLKNDENMATALQATEYFKALVSECSLDPLEPYLAELVPLLAFHVVLPESERTKLLSEFSLRHVESLQGEYSVRLLSTSIMDLLSYSTLEQECFNVILPIVKQMLSSDQWYVVEGGVLIMEEIAWMFGRLLPREDLIELIQMLFPISQANNPVVNNRICWALSRYSIVSEMTELTIPACELFCTTIMQPDSPIHESAICGLLCQLEASVSSIAHELAAKSLVPNLETIPGTVDTGLLITACRVLILSDIETEYCVQTVTFINKTLSHTEDNRVKSACLLAFLDALGADNAVVMQFAEDIYYTCWEHLDSLEGDSEEYLITNYLDVVIAILIRVAVHDPIIVERAICYANSSSPVVLTSFCGLAGAIYKYSEHKPSEEQSMAIVQRLTVLMRDDFQVSQSASWALSCIASVQNSTGSY